MTVDMLTATLFWPEGAFVPMDDLVPEDPNEAPSEASTPADPLAVHDDASFWTILLRTMGWPLPRKIAIPS